MPRGVRRLILNGPSEDSRHLLGKLSHGLGFVRHVEEHTVVITASEQGVDKVEQPWPGAAFSLRCHRRLQAHRDHDSHTIIGDAGFKVCLPMEHDTAAFVEIMDHAVHGAEQAPIGGHTLPPAVDYDTAPQEHAEHPNDEKRHEKQDGGEDLSARIGATLDPATGVAGRDREPANCEDEAKRCPASVASTNLHAAALFQNRSP